MKNDVEDAFQGPRRALTTLKKGVFLNVIRRLLNPQRASIGFKEYEKDLHQSLIVSYYPTFHLLFLQSFFYRPIAYHLYVFRLVTCHADGTYQRRLVLP